MACCIDIQERLARRVAQPPALPIPDINKKHRKAWGSLGFPRNIYDHHTDFGEFLFKARLLTPLAGYQQTIGQPSSEAIQTIDGEPHILVQGEWRSWTWIQENLDYDETDHLLVSKHDVQEIWMPASPRVGGVISCTRENRIVPIHRLTEAEHAALVKHANEAAQVEGSLKTCVVQIVTSPNPPLPDHPLSENFNESMPTHIWVRLITGDGFVYSLGLKILPDEIKEELYPPGASMFTVAGNFLKTFNGHLGTPDYKEFQKYPEGRFVTSLPATQEQAEEILHMVAAEFGQGIRMNYMHQNCSILPREVLKILGEEVDMRTTGLNFVWQMVPGIEQIPYVGTAWKAIKVSIGMLWTGVCDAAPDLIKWVFAIICDVVAYIPGKIGTFLANIVILGVLGGAKGTPVPDHLQNQPDQLENTQKPTFFTSLWQGCATLFDDEVSLVYHSKAVTDWQQLHPATVCYTEAQEGRLPKMCLIPPPPAMPIDAVGV